MLICTINPPGFALENYDAMGGFRTEDNGLPVDASGSLLLSKGEELHFANGVDLAHELAGSTQVQDCYSLLWLRYALGFEIGAGEEGVSSMQKSFRDNDNIIDLLVSIVGSDLFRYRNAGGAP